MLIGERSSGRTFFWQYQLPFACIKGAAALEEPAALVGSTLSYLLAPIYVLIRPFHTILSRCSIHPRLVLK